MKKTLIAVSTLLIASACLAAPAQASKDPVMYEKARAIPTQSGKNVRITLYTRHVKTLRASVDGSRTMKAIPFGKGCNGRCDKWKLYAKRIGNECYEIAYESNTSGIAGLMSACEPFRFGQT